ncbi:hypothetical protein EBB07_00070 [Paenibacillaceae bacterium]|nr:hypothetical protein EBB07_00070 [Paenibacillaceae bacterium]
MQFDFNQLAVSTNLEFATFISRKIEDQLAVREIMNYLMTEDHDEEEVVVEMLFGWRGKAQALWTFIFCKEYDSYSGHVVNSNQVERFLELSKG